MRRSPGRRHFNQLDLFHPPPRTPQWHRLPLEVRQSATKLIALMLRRHVSAHPIGEETKGVRDE